MKEPKEKVIKEKKVKEKKVKEKKVVEKNIKPINEYKEFKENIILFIPMDTTNLELIPNFIEDVIPQPSNLNKLNDISLYDIKNERDKDDEILNFEGQDHFIKNEIVENMIDMNNINLEYNVEIDEQKKPFMIHEPKKISEKLDFSNIFIQFRECNKNMEWPISTNIHCKLCCHPFTSRPWYLPIDYINNIFIVKYIFCSPNCVKRYNLDFSGQEFSKRNSLFELMLKVIYNKKDISIKCALQQDMLSIFGGPYSIEKFREDFEYIDTENELIYPEILSVIPFISQYKQKKEINNNEEYKLKRTKPLVRKNKTVLDNIMKK